MELVSQPASSGVCNRTTVVAETEIRAAQLPLTCLSSFVVIYIHQPWMCWNPVEGEIACCEAMTGHPPALTSSIVHGMTGRHLHQYFVRCYTWGAGSPVEACDSRKLHMLWDGVIGMLVRLRSLVSNNPTKLGSLAGHRGRARAKPVECSVLECARDSNRLRAIFNIHLRHERARNRSDNRSDYGACFCQRHIR